MNRSLVSWHNRRSCDKFLSTHWRGAHDRHDAIIIYAIFSRSEKARAEVSFYCEVLLLVSIRCIDLGPSLDFSSG
jgi:hypothetical protein